MEKLNDLYDGSTSGDKSRLKRDRPRGLKVYKSRQRALRVPWLGEATLAILTEFWVHGMEDNYACEVLLFPKDLQSNVVNNVGYVFCQCPHFRYVYAFVLNKKGNLIPKKNLNIAMTKAPDITNPKRDVSMCKHLLAVTEYLERNSVNAKKLLSPEGLAKSANAQAKAAPKRRYVPPVKK